MLTQHGNSVLLGHVTFICQYDETVAIFSSFCDVSGYDVSDMMSFSHASEFQKHLFLWTEILNMDLRPTLPSLVKLNMLIFAYFYHAPGRQHAMHAELNIFCPMSVLRLNEFTYRQILFDFPVGASF